MAKVVAKRKLRKSYYDNNSVDSILNDSFIGRNDVNINGLYRRNGAKPVLKDGKKNNKENKRFLENFQKKITFKLAIQSVIMIAIICFVFCIKYLNIEIVTKSEIAQKIVKEFKKDYKIQEVISGVEEFLDETYLFISPIIPDKLSEKSIAVFNNFFSNDINNNIEIYNENQEIQIYKETNIEESKQDKTPIQDTVIAVSSSISSYDKYINLIKNTGIEFVKPTIGVITSHFGTREKIFEDSETFHYGTDIANNNGTPVYASMDGKVTVCSYNYQTGNYIEIENGKVTTRYSHLSKQLVKVGDNVLKGQEIGKMGDTGYATGNHLHFEIMYERNRVDAERILKLD